MKNALASAPVYDINIPDGLPDLHGTFSRADRVAIAMDVLAVLATRGRKFELGSTYFQSFGHLPSEGQLNSSAIKSCTVCARDLLFIKSLDRFNNFDLEGVHRYDLSEFAANWTEDEWGYAQARLIEYAYEDFGDDEEPATQFHYLHGGLTDRKSVVKDICNNIISNHGEFIP